MSNGSTRCISLQSLTAYVIACTGFADFRVSLSCPPILKVYSLCKSRKGMKLFTHQRYIKDVKKREKMGIVCCLLFGYNNCLFFL